MKEKQLGGNIIKLALSCAFVISSVISQNGYAQESSGTLASDAASGGGAASTATTAPTGTTDGATTTTTTTTTTDTSTTSSHTLQGGVKGTAVPFFEGTVKIGMATKLIQETTMSIMKEATRKDTIVMRGPNVLPGGVVIPALGGSNGVMQFGEMPIRKDRLLRWVGDTEQNIGALKTYIDGLILPPEKQAEAEPIYTAMRGAMENAEEHLAILKDLSSQKRLVNGKIGRQALSINDAMTEIDKQRNKLMEVVNAGQPQQ